VVGLKGHHASRAKEREEGLSSLTAKEKAKENQKARTKALVAEKGKVAKESQRAKAKVANLHLERGVPRNTFSVWSGGTSRLVKNPEYAKIQSTLLMDQIYCYDLLEDTVCCEVCQYCLQESCTHESCAPQMECGI
jgi:hypothetical protein